MPSSLRRSDRARILRRGRACQIHRICPRQSAWRDAACIRRSAISLSLRILKPGAFPEGDSFRRDGAGRACVNESVGRAFSRRIALDMVPAAPPKCRPIRWRSDASSPIFCRMRCSTRRKAAACASACARTKRGGHQRDGQRQRLTPDEASRAGVAFRRFERPGVSTGTGLGLAIVVALARRMGGAVRLSSAYAKEPARNSGCRRGSASSDNWCSRCLMLRQAQHEGLAIPSP